MASDKRRTCPWLGPAADRKQHTTFAGGHIPMELHGVIRTILDWFEKYLGPVA